MIKNEIVNQIAEHGTPFFVFDEGAFQSRLREIDRILNEGREVTRRIKLCYAAKANSFLLPAANEVVDKLEICSQGEMDIVHSLGMDGKKVLYSGVSKTGADIGKAISQGMCHATAESVRHVELLQEEAKKAGVSLHVLLRLNSGAQFGMCKKDLEQLLSEREKYSSLTFEGIHYFKGTQRKKIKQQIEELAMLKDYIAFLREKFQLPLTQLEYGPGLPVPYFEGEDFSDTLQPIKELKEALIEATEWADVTVEMGRFYAASCGNYVTAVTDLKDTDDAHVVILDGGIHQLTYAGQMMGMKIPKMSLVRAAEMGSSKEDNPKHYMLCGSLCTTGDVLVRDVELPNLRMGDLLSFENVGAYTVTEGIGLFLSHDLPAIYLYNESRNVNEKVRMVRDFIATSKLNSDCKTE